MVKMVHGSKKIAAFGRVVYGRQDIGMGIVFTTIEPKTRGFVRIGSLDLLLRSECQVQIQTRPEETRMVIGYRSSRTCHRVYFAFAGSSRPT